MAIPPINSAQTQLTPSVAATAGVSAMESPKSVSPPEADKLSNEQIEQTVDEIRRRIEPVDRNLQFSIDKDTGKTVVKLIDTATKEVLRQIPSEELLSIARALGKGQSGLIERKA